MSQSDRSSQAGSTILESILVILLVGVIILTLASGLLASTVAGRKVNDSQRLNLATTSVTESLRDMQYRPSSAGCSPTADAAGYLADYNALPAEQRSATAGLTVEVVKVEYWKLAYPPTTIAASAQWSGVCSVATGAQKITVRLTLPQGVAGGTGSATAEVVKRQSSRQG